MSRLPFELFLALRYLRPKRTFVSIITLISILGVALGVAVLIIVISVMSGFDHDLRNKILGFSAHITVKEMGSTMRNYRQVAALVAQNKKVRGVSPFVFGPVLVETQLDTNRASMVDAPMLRGVDPKTEGTVSQLPEEIKYGKFDLTGRGVLVGLDFADNLQLQVGDTLSIYSIREFKKMKEAHDQHRDVAILPDDYEVRGIFDTGYYEYNSRVIVTSLANAQELYDLDDSVHGLFVTLNDPYQAEEVKTQLEETLNYKLNDGTFVAQTWMDANSGILGALVVEKNVMFYLLFFIVLVAALCILSAQITFVIQKTREIGMLKALGATQLQISSIFLGQSAIIGVMGVAAGCGLGMLAVTYRNEFLHFMRQATGWELFPKAVYGFGDLPALIMPRDVAIICLSSFVICVLGGLLPALRAGRLKPVEALRYE
ncbi:MAG TPA: ABC transporter permease [Candidatus Acidoferrales bacterium]|nr:ABC transporter permease [Candidatus Acidoferrales bacterium]